MTDISRVRIEVTGTGVIGPSVLTLYTAGLGGDLSAAARTWLNAQAAFFSTDVTYLCPGDGDVIDDATGDITGAWSGTLPAAVVGSSGGAYARGVGYSVKWGTAGVVNSHHVRGRSFLVPCVGSCFTSDGGIDPTTSSTITTASQAMITTLAGNFRIWSRPTPDRAGSSHAVTSASVVQNTAWLKTR